MVTNKHGGISFRKTVSSLCIGATLLSISTPVIGTYVEAETLKEGPTDSSSLVSNSGIYQKAGVNARRATATESSSSEGSNSESSKELETNEEEVITTPSSSTNNSSSSKGNSNNNSNSGNQNSNSSSRDEEVVAKPEKKDSDNKSESEETKPSAADNTPIKYTRNISTLEFVEEIGEDAREIGQKYDLYASVMIAQAILESASGNSRLAKSPNNNLFGIKGKFQGNYVEMSTLEDNGKGGMYTVSAKFRKYPDKKASIDDYASLMKGGTDNQSSYYAGAFKSNTQNYREATNFLTGRYATDTRYYEKLNGLIETYDLTKYDQKKAKAEVSQKTPETIDFIKDISGDAKKIAEKNDMYASILIAEAVIKSNSGKHPLAKGHNIYELTGEYEGKSKSIDYFKKENNKMVLKEEKFKEYPSYEASISDYIDTLKKDSDNFAEMTLAKKDNYRKVTAFLTAQNKDDRQYHKKLNTIVETYDLTKYDKKVTVKDDKAKRKEKERTLSMLNKVGNSLSKTLSESLNQPVKYEIGES